MERMSKREKAKFEEPWAEWTPSVEYQVAWAKASVAIEVSAEHVRAYSEIPGHREVLRHYFAAKRAQRRYGKYAQLMDDLITEGKQ